MFNKNKLKTINLIDFSIRYIGTGQIGNYIIEYLYNQLKFKHIGYRLDNKDGDIRCTLYTFSDNKEPIRYFKDRCSGMIEEKVQTMKGIPHKFYKWSNGFTEVSL